MDEGITQSLVNNVFIKWISIYIALHTRTHRHTQIQVINIYTSRCIPREKPLSASRKKKVMCAKLNPNKNAFFIL